jgi:sulfur carrier protein ThiS adenylyltransferase
VEALTANLRRINPAIDIAGHQVRLTPENIPGIFAEATVIAECFDRSEQKQMLVETVLVRMTAPIVTVSGLAGYGRSNEIVTQRITSRLVLVGDGVNAARPGVPLTAPRVGVAAHHQANAILEIMLTNGRKQVGGSWQ